MVRILRPGEKVLSEASSKSPSLSLLWKRRTQ